ncbi:wax ester/triacylglycerol synthase family O-acyltransferase [Oleomonas cavernae]|uniref:diacylglycerol O-acyltransferase n=1 Tax=Oleomonas cavernae TaxID=2320859 RepID=A0A418WC00_9PROT|nr:wax ester/triacylglycerol synthase family O-acyltransferase [Oleomonas cavernae]RJF87545.1 wax ester/triacylglycerol synthase family O-acyltransferase [Oleomonas cavernae]
MERLSGLDASFLYLETPTNHMHVGGLWIVEMPEGYKGGYFDTVKKLVESRLHLARAYRRRLLMVPLDIDHPLWIEDPDFDIDFHMRHIAVPPPGDMSQLLDQVARLHSRPLDRSRPLWEFYVIEGLADNRAAVYTKIHHCCIDGVAGTELMVSLLDFAPEPRNVAPPDKPWVPERAPNDVEVLARAAVHGIVKPMSMLRRIPKLLGTVLNVGRRALEPGASLPPAPFQAPRTPFNRALTPHRRFAVKTIPLSQVKAVKNALGCTVNDVVLALCSGALRRYLAKHGQLPDKPLIAMCPISVRSEEQKGELNNRVSGMLVSLATDVDDVIERVAAIKESTKDAKESYKALPADMLRDWSLFAAPLVAARAARLYSRYKIADYHRPPFNVVVSNVPGPSFPLYLGGAQVLHTYPVSIPADSIALNITVQSYTDNIEFGLIVDREAVPDVEDLADMLPLALAELTAAGSAKDKPKEKKAKPAAGGRPSSLGAGRITETVEEIAAKKAG